eukprot:scaffold420747_cov17-Prasinocladus_malaysianus.AAC.1
MSMLQVCMTAATLHVLCNNVLLILYVLHWCWLKTSFCHDANTYAEWLPQQGNLGRASHNHLLLILAATSSPTISSGKRFRMPDRRRRGNKHQSEHSIQRKGHCSRESVLFGVRLVDVDLQVEGNRKH